MGVIKGRLHRVFLTLLGQICNLTALSINIFNAKTIH